MTTTLKVTEDMIKELVSKCHTKVKAILEEGQRLFWCKLCDYSCKHSNKKTPKEKI